jgi:putative hydrolase of the HAD superfamily
MSGNMNIKAVLFDLYNTLLEIRTDEGNREVWEKLARFLRYRRLRADAEHMYSTYFSQVEISKSECPEEHAEVDVVGIFGTMLTEMGYQGPPSFHEEVTQLFRTLSIVRFATFPDTFPSLSALQQRFKLGLVSDAQRAFFDPEVAMTGLHPFMNVIVVSSDYGYRKPDPRLFFKALEILAVPAEQAVYVGDNVGRDICGAKNAGMGAVLINRNGYQEELESDCQPDRVFRNLDEAKHWLLD